LSGRFREPPVEKNVPVTMFAQKGFIRQR